MPSLKNTLPLRRSGRTVYGRPTVVACSGVGTPAAVPALGGTVTAGPWVAGAATAAVPCPGATASSSGLADFIRSGDQYSPAASAVRPETGPDATLPESPGVPCAGAPCAGATRTVSARALAATVTSPLHKQAALAELRARIAGTPS